MEKNEALTALYNLLAAPLYGPASPAWPAVVSGEWAGALADTFRVLAIDLPVPQPGPDLADAFHRTFTEPGCRLVPVESVHKVWTEAPDVEMPHAREKGWLYGDPARHMDWLYGQAGIEIPPEMIGTPDHLALELEFMGLLAEAGTAEQRALFRQQHLDWVAELADQAEEAQVPPFYRDLLRLIAAVVARPDSE